MAFGVAKALVLLQLSLLFVGSFTEDLDGLMSAQPAKTAQPSKHHRRGHAPSLPPKPAPGPAHPVLPSKTVAVQGAVYCKSCKYSGVDTLTGAKPVIGAVVQMQCNVSKSPQVYQATTDKNGYFFLQGPKQTIYGAHKCKVVLGPCPLSSCRASKPALLHDGASGVFLAKPSILKDFLLYTVGPWAYEPKCPRIDMLV